MNSSIQAGISSSETHLPGILNVKRRAPGLWKRLQGVSTVSSAPVTRFESDVASESEGNAERGLQILGQKMRVGRWDHDLPLGPVRDSPVFMGIEYLSCMAIAVSRVVRYGLKGRRGAGW